MRGGKAYGEKMSDKRKIFNFRSAIAVSLLGVLATACSKKADYLVVEEEEKRKEAIVEISTVNQELNSGNTLVPVTNKPVTSNVTKFSSSAYGVAGSPRVTQSAQVRKGGGRYQIGKPYTIRGKRYYPREDPNYNKTGVASWYGPNFHGRLTANGEVYDQFALSAAHPTMPLPSYAKVTNLENGSSVIVRVNDRGPFSNNRIIDLSARAAQLLGYEKKGIAKVRVKYVGKARMDGLDEQYLVASYNPGNLDPNQIPTVSGNGSVQIAQTENNGRKPLSAFSAGDLSTPVPQTRPATDTGVPLILGVNGVLRPTIGLSSYAAHSELNGVAINALDKFGASEHLTMRAITQVHFGPFNKTAEIVDVEQKLLLLGAVTEYYENNNRYLILTTTRENLNRVHAAIDAEKLPVKR